MGDKALLLCNDMTMCNSGYRLPTLEEWRYDSGHFCILREHIIQVDIVQ